MHRAGRRRGPQVAGCGCGAGPAGSALGGVRAVRLLGELGVAAGPGACLAWCCCLALVRSASLATDVKLLGRICMDEGCSASCYCSQGRDERAAFVSLQALNLAHLIAEICFSLVLPMASFGWKRRIGEKVSRATSQQFEAEAADEKGPGGDEDEDWVHATKRRKEVLLEDCIKKSKQLKDEGASLAENRRY